MTRLLLLEKNDVDWEGAFEGLDAVEVIEDFRESPIGILSFDSDVLSVCFVERKPKAPREAMVAAGLASALGQGRRWTL